MTRIGFSKRSVALFVDQLIGVLIAFAAIMAFMMLAFSGVTPDLTHSGDIENPSTTLLIVVSLGYLFKPLYFSTEIFFGASPGKMMLGLVIGNSQASTATNPDMLATRWLIKNSPDLLALIAVLCYNLPIASTLLFLLAGLASFILAIGCFGVFGQNKQTLHDLLSNTAVYMRDEFESHRPAPLQHSAPTINTTLPPAPDTRRAVDELIWK